MGVNCRPARLAEPHQRQVAALCHFDRQRCRSRHRKQDLHAAHGRFLHHFIAGAAGNERGPLLPDVVFPSATAQQLIQRDVAANIFMPADTPRANIVECQQTGAKVTLIDGLITDRLTESRKALFGQNVRDAAGRGKASDDRGGAAKRAFPNCRERLVGILPRAEGRGRPECGVGFAAAEADIFARCPNGGLVADAAHRRGGGGGIGSSRRAV